jgi:uncharacterized membrane protein
MTREGFLNRLREGLRHLPPAARDEILADYAGYFNDGVEAGRTEAEVASALGDPDRLARELRAEIGLKRWEQERSPGAAAAAVFAVLGLGAIDILVLLPILLFVVSTLFGFYIAAIFGFFAGGFIFAAGPFWPVPGGPFTALLAGLGVMAGSVAGIAILTLITIGLVNALVWYGRLHFQILKPAIEPQA